MNKQFACFVLICCLVLGLHPFSLSADQKDNEYVETENIPVLETTSPSALDVGWKTPQVESTSPAAIQIELAVGNYVRLDVDGSVDHGLLWCSSDPDTAIVNQNGKVTALAEGTVLISVESMDGKFKDQVYIRVVGVHMQRDILPAST